jgi:uncharacterized membrane protein
MNRLQIGSLIVSVITIICLILGRFAFTFPDWLVRIAGILMLISIFCLVFSTVRLREPRKRCTSFYWGDK